jgi:hypothetical protein
MGRLPKKIQERKDATIMKLKLEGHTNLEIAKHVGITAKDDVAKSLVSQAIKRITNSESFADVLDQYGATDKIVIETAVKCLNAGKEIRVQNAEGAEDGSILIADWPTRLKAAEMIGRWKGWDKLTLQGQDGKNFQVEVTVTEALKKIYGLTSDGVKQIRAANPPEVEEE